MERKETKEKGGREGERDREGEEKNMSEKTRDEDRERGREKRAPPHTQTLFRAHRILATK